MLGIIWRLGSNTSDLFDENEKKFSMGSIFSLYDIILNKKSYVKLNLLTENNHSSLILAYEKN